jgi:hypothetical protein
MASTLPVNGLALTDLARGHIIFIHKMFFVEKNPFWVVMLASGKYVQRANNMCKIKILYVFEVRHTKKLKCTKSSRLFYATQRDTCNRTYLPDASMETHWTFTMN